MAENKFIKHLKGEQAVGSLVEIKNQNTPASFGNMPQGTSDSNVKYSDVRGDVTVVANGTTAWKLNDSALTLAPIVNGDGTDYTGKYEVSGAGLWVNSTYTFPSTGDPNHPVAMIFNPNSKWVLKLCGDNLIVNDGNTLELTVVITIGSSNIISKQFTIREQANQFCKELVIDFDESNASMIKASGLATLQLQVLCGTADASARIYNGMSTLTVLQRKVDASVVSGSFANVEEVMRYGLLPNDYFSNAAYIAQIEDGDSAYAVFTRDGDDVALSGWVQPIPDQTNNAGKFLTTDGSLMSWAQLTISDVDGLSTELSDLQDQITINKGTMDSHIGNTNNPHSVTKAQVGLGNVDNTSDLNKPISTATQTALNGKQNTISDLATIRSNAQAGKAASDTIATYGDIVTHDVSEFATAAQGAKADTALQTGDNVSELVNDAGYLVMSDLTNFVTRNTAQTISGLKTFSADITLSGTTSIKNTTSGVSYTMLYRDASGIHVGTSTQALLLAGSNARPKFNNNDVAMLSDIPTAVSQLTNDTGFITNAVNDLQNYTLTSNLATVALTGSYNDLSDKPTIPSMSNRVNGASLSNLASVFYGTSSTAAATVEKVVSIPSITTLDVGTIIVVQPTATSTVANSTIKLNNFSAYPMRYNNAAITTSTDSIVWNATYPSVWVFDGTYWYFVAHGIDSNTTYSAMSVAEGTTGTATSNRVLQAANLKQIIQGTTLTGIDVATTGAVSATDTITDGIGKLQATKADKSEIPTVNNPTITITQGGVTKGSFTLNQATGDTIALDAGGSGIGNIDNLTITANADQEIQTVATINANTATGATNPIYDWVGTLAEYTAQNIATTHPDWLCYITDDNTAQAFDAYSKTESNARYVQQGHQVIEFQEPTSANNYTWYRKYADGWVEQGGKATTTSVSLPITMADTNYQVLMTQIGSSSAYAAEPINLSTTGFTYWQYQNVYNAYWQVSGLAA